MKTLLILIFLITSLTGLYSQDVEGSKDYPLFPRIAGFSILDYTVQNYAIQRFCDEDGNNMQVEGMVTSLYYECDCDIDPMKIINSLTRVVSDLGGKVYGEGPNQRWMVLKHENRLLWVDLFAEDFYYTLTIIEKGDLVSEISPESFLNDLNLNGRSVIYFNFDRNMCIIKEECKPVISLISEALKGSPDLKILIVGYTDDIGSLDANIMLSTNRAVAIANALVEDGIDASRIEAQGLGEEKPIASNETLEGRTLNNRIEIIKK